MLKKCNRLRKYVAYARIYANFWIRGIIFTHAFLKMPIYAGKYAMREFWQNVRLLMQSHIRI